MKWKITAAFPLALAAALWIGNTSLFSRFPDGKPLRIIAHRGQHQLFDTSHVENDTCTASLMLPPTHAFLENSIAGMKAAFDAGADVVELDVHLTPDKQFAVFHDWTLDCRTEANGVTEQTPMPVLKTLDIGYGYTADGGRTFPFRGQGKGLMPTLPEVFAALPDGRFLINFKSRRTEEGEALAALLNADAAARAATFGVYGGNEPTERAVGLVRSLPGYSNRSAKSCLLNYLALGWMGHVPETCRNTLVPVPANLAFLLWGWPERFYDRMRAAGSDVVLIGPFEAGDAGSSGIDDRDGWDMVPPGFPGLVWTNVIEKVKPEVERRGFCALPSKPLICG
ncbi:glycerophosphodiester phosphodiesterase family protein [Neorhizobium galegae]|uniref:glycerophosphodiester phosphodiesterase family protein n=1 Tax=Neorhizobium galegae TaxID=399 RepID=UPI002102542C|nr:glycerophosphodiester phosphodiesterase family protein [Neorhizobium galegae]MCQ1855437.1 glycerophosphodiester phosphodiesterase [Neorhizobium galegae]